MVPQVEVVELKLFELMDIRTNTPVLPWTPPEAMALRSELVVKLGEDCRLYATHVADIEAVVLSKAFSARDVTHMLVDNIATALREELKAAVKKFIDEPVDGDVSKS